LTSKFRRGIAPEMQVLKKKNYSKLMIWDMQKMREHRLCEIGISNYRSQMTTGGARGGSMIWWCEKNVLKFQDLY
jgi:hypothetical protein